MALAAGTKLGVYQVVAPIGSGGMGEVYRARDTKLHRDVALKVLPELFALEPDRLGRFEREAQLLASLNHPNIAAIYGFEEVGAGFSRLGGALVLELVDGPTLADRIAQGPIPLDDALPIARQIAEALEAAHEHGIIHRDLKPANIKLRPDGTVKVLDFGLAKALEGDIAAADVTHSPTVTVAGTSAGVILGTAAYMAPEQAKGITLDRRADIFAFGAVLYEMLTGSRAFQGDTATEILAAVLKGEPDWTLLPQDTPEAIRRVLRRCLQKDRSRRLQTAGDVRIEIEEAITGEGALPLRDVEAKRGAGVAWITASVLAVVAALMAVPSITHLREAPRVDAPEMRLDIVTPATTDEASFALSPDGRQLVFVASGGGPSRLWLRLLGSASSQPLAGTEGAQYPFWSPDSRSVGFFAGGKLRRLDLDGGQPQVLTDAAPRYGSWSADGVILFARTAASPLFRISASGGEAVPATKLDREITTHRFPYFLPDGQQFLFYARDRAGAGGIYLGSLDSADTTRLTAAGAPGVYIPTGWLLWVRGETLTAQRLDLRRRTLTGDPVRVADQVLADDNVNAVSASATGVVAYRPRSSGGGQLTWFDRSGKALGTVGAPEETGLRNPRVSPDGRRVAVFRTVQGNSDMWLLDGIRATRFTFANAGIGYWPLWSPDGERIVFDSARKGARRNLYMKPSTGAGSEELLLESPQPKTATSWSDDGRFLLYMSNDPQTDYDLWVLPLDGDRKPWIFLKTDFDERNAQFSPDGRWVAYQSNESGQQEIYVRPFAEPVTSGTAGRPAGGQWQVSTAGGLDPRWRPEGKELYYIAPDGQVMAAPIAATDTAIEPGAPVALFHTRMVEGGRADIGPGQNYDVARDGRFLISTILADAAAPITLLLNWKPPEP